jgi:A/G-specific adenine glycosylase
VTRAASLADWYVQHGRHELPWRATRDRWPVLVSEVMLQQTQVSRVLDAWPGFIGRFPTADSMASEPPGAVITEWGRLGYPRRARRLWEASAKIADEGWPADLEELPGVGRYTARALLAQCDDRDVPAVEVNVRRVLQRAEGSVLTERACETAMRRWGEPLTGRDRLLALMDLGATVCTARDAECPRCPLTDRCATRGVLPGETRAKQAPYRGSFRERRGIVMRRLRSHRSGISTDDLDGMALSSLVEDGLAVVSRGWARLP